MAVIVSNPEVNLTITEAPDHLTVSGPSAFSSAYAPYFTQVKGRIVETSADKVDWQIPKSHDAGQVLSQILGYDITTKYTLQAPPKPITVAGMTFTPPTPLPTPSSLPVPAARPERVERQPARLIGGGEAQQWWIYDYSPASVAVFIGRSLYEQNGHKLLEQAGGKSSSLYPDGDGSMSRRGWIFAKSNKGGMDYLSQMLGVDIKTLSDFSQVRSRGRRPDDGEMAPYVPHALGPQMTSGPFPQGLASIPGIPEPGAVLSGTDLLTKAFRDFATTVKTVSPGVYVIGTPEMVTTHLTPVSVVEFEFELHGLKCVKLSS